ncbi:amine oxidase, partial [Plakobranchus ocellatus]
HTAAKPATYITFTAPYRTENNVAIKTLHNEHSHNEQVTPSSRSSSTFINRPRSRTSTDSGHIELSSPDTSDIMLDDPIHMAHTRQVVLSSTYIGKLQQLTHSITTDTITTEHPYEISNTSNTNTDTMDQSYSHDDIALSSQAHSTIPLVPVAESTPLKPPRPHKSKIDTSTSPMIKYNTTFSHSLSLSENTPLSKEEEKFSTHLIRHKFHSGLDKNRVKCKTGGQPLILQRVVAPRKQSLLVRTPTKRKRDRILHNVRSYVAGTSETSADTQLATELKTLPSTRRQIVTQKAGIKQKIKISRHHTLAIKEALSMSWRQGRKHGKLLREVGIQLENEKSVRDLAKHIVSDFVKVEGRQFLKDDDREYIAPYGRVVGLTKFVDYLLDSYQQQNMLTWHNDIIPSDEIWVKIGGDRGKNSLKFTLQIANIDKPNARQNTVVIAIAAVKDTHKNIERFLQGGLGNELFALQSHSWKGKMLKVS